MSPYVRSFMATHQLPGVTVVADAGMVSEANQKQIEAAGLSFILGLRIPEVPWVIAEWHLEPGRRRSSGTGSSSSAKGTHRVNRELEAKARALAGIKGYITNLQACPDGTPSPRSS